MLGFIQRYQFFTLLALATGFFFLALLSGYDRRVPVWLVVLLLALACMDWIAAAAQASSAQSNLHAISRIAVPSMAVVILLVNHVF